MLKILNTGIAGGAFTSAYPYDMAALSSDALPRGCPILTTIFVVDKVDVVFSDGEDNWYHEADKPVAAGQPISALF